MFSSFFIGLFVFLLLSFKSFSRYKSFVDMWLENIFPQSIAFLSLSVFHKAKGFHFNKVRFVNFFSFMSCAFNIKSKKTPWSQVINISTISSSKSCIVLHFTSMIYFWVNFCIKCETEVKLFLSLAFRGILLHMDVQLFQHHILKRLSFFHLIAFLLLLTTDILWLHCLIYSDPLVYVSIPPPVPQCLNYCSFTVSFKIR